MTKNIAIALLALALVMSMTANGVQRYQRIYDRETINQSTKLLFQARDIMGGLIHIVKACKAEKESAQ